MKRHTTSIILIIIISGLVIAALGVAMGIHHLTIIEWWKPTTVCALLSLAAALGLIFCLRKRNRYTKRSPLPEYATAAILSFSIFLASFYCLNYFLSDSATGYEYDAPVVRKYSEERTRTHKTGRRSSREEKYRVYCIELEMKDGKIKKMEKPLREYNRIKKGGTLKIHVEQGFFKIPVIKNHKHKPT